MRRYRLCLNSAMSSEIKWHCEHYCGRGLMKELTGEQLAAEMNVSPQHLQVLRDWRARVRVALALALALAWRTLSRSNGRLSSKQSKSTQLFARCCAHCVACNTENTDHVRRLQRRGEE
jgi:hypothetical protein